MKPPPIAVTWGIGGVAGAQHWGMLPFVAGGLRRRALVGQESDASAVVGLLAHVDEHTRAARAERLAWVSRVDTRPAAYMGPVDTLRVMKEASDCFVNGHFVATLMLATAFVEHTLFDELLDRNIVSENSKPTLEKVIDLARKNLALPDGLLTQADEVREYRNPFVHRRPADDRATLRNRFVAQKSHPDSIVESDAKLALGVMFELFKHTLRELS